MTRPEARQALAARRGHAPADHGVIDALARTRGDDPRRVTGENHVATVVPAVERLERDRPFPLKPGRRGGRITLHSPRPFNSETNLITPAATG